MRIALHDVDTIKGGTGYGLFSELPLKINDMFPDYSIFGLKIL